MPPRSRARGSRRRDRRRARRGRVLRGQLDERLPVGLDDVLARDRDARPRPALRLRLERRRRKLVLERGHRLELELPVEPLFDPRDQLRASALEALVVRRARVPAVRAAALAQGSRMLHERDAAALDRPGDERLRTVGDRAQLAEHAPQLVVVVAVAGSDVPAERGELLPRGRRARGSPPSACRTGARCGRRRPSAPPAGREPHPASASKFWPS